MKQTMHIFMKDVRHLWPGILVVLTFTAAFAYAGAVSPGAFGQLPDPYPTLTALTLPLGWAYLIAAVIHQEALPGHHQYWLTRPYSWKSLLVAKALFIVSFINVPKLLADFVILEGQGFQAASYWSGFIASQLLFTAVWLLPYSALAAVTSNLRQFVLAVLIVWVLLILPSLFLARPSDLLSRGFWFGAVWMQNFMIIGIFLTASLVILLWQYSRRRTALSRVIALCAMILVLAVPNLISMRALMAAQMRLSKSRMDVPAIQAVLDSTRKEPKTKQTGRRPGYEGTIAIGIPLQISGLPAGTSMFFDDVKVEIEEPDGEVSVATGTIEQEVDGVWERLFVRPDVFQRLKEEQVTLRHSAYLSLLGDPRTTQIEPGERGTVVPDLGICRFVRQGSDYTIVCFTPFRRSPVFASTSIPDFGYGDDPEPASYSPFPAEPGISPLVTSARVNGATEFQGSLMPRVVTKSAFAHIRHDFEIRGLRLEDCALRD